MEAFDPSKSIKPKLLTKKNLLKSLVLMVLFTVIGITYSMFEIENEDIIINSDTDAPVNVKVLVDGVEQASFPTKESGYMYSNLVCENGSTGTWSSSNWELKLSMSGYDNCTINFVAPASTAITNLVGNGEVFDENGIRYQGTDPNNYVVLEEGGEVYRIIGVFDTLLADGTTTESLVKLIKEETITNVSWDSGNVNNWNTSTLKTILNNDFLNNTGSYTENGLNNQKEMIADVTWKLGGTGSYLTAEGYYNAERGTAVYTGRPTTGTGSVGLMYPSDYMYAVKATDCARTTDSNSYGNTSACHENNWLYSVVNEWTLTPISSVEIYVWHASSLGSMGIASAAGASFARPTIYLKENAYIASGVGSASDPYLIQVPPTPASETITNLVGNGEVFNENGIRYQGDNPNNYAVLEEGGEVYRIIGVFDTVLADGTTTESLVKLIKEETIGNNPWNTSNINDWNTSSLKINFNTNFLNSSGSYTTNGLNSQKEIIADVSWYLGGANSYLTAEGFYNAERGTQVASGRSTTGTGSVGLMYPSDYMYAVKAADCARTTSASYYDNISLCHDNNWLYEGVTEWTITPNSLSTNTAWSIVSSGYIATSYSTSTNFLTRPVIYMKSSTTVKGGSGSAADPYLIN